MSIEYSFSSRREGLENKGRISLGGEKQHRFSELEVSMQAFWKEKSLDKHFTIPQSQSTI